MRRLLVIVALGGFASSGCASTLKVTYHSQPEGAMLYANDGGRLLGNAPLTFTHKMSRSFFSGTQCTAVQPMATMRWASGVEASVAQIAVCPDNGRQQQLTLIRPDVPFGRELDAQVATAYQREAMIKAQENAERQAAHIKELHEIEAAALERQMSCTSNNVGTFVFTNCY